VYEVRSSDAVDEQSAALPPAAAASLVELREALSLSPWTWPPYTAAYPEGSMRTATFADGAGIVYFLILEDQRLVDLLDVIWLG
jgi:hypothetical protein